MWKVPYNTGMKVLLVDDDSFLLDMYSVKFTEAGHEVVAVKDGDQALAILRKDGDFDGVVLDIVMPGQSGIEVLRTIKKEKLCKKECKYIMLSNQGEEADADTAKEAGATGYIVKAEMMPGEVVEKITRMVTV